MSKCDDLNNRNWSDLMFWQEIYLDRIIKKYELINTLHYMFAVDEKEILICTNIANCDVGNEIKIICETSFLETSYPLKICIFIKEDSIIPSNDILCIGEMAERLECKILMSDDSINPYSMLQINSREDYHSTSIDLESYENNIEYMLED